jgi:hypothetical protein
VLDEPAILERVLTGTSWCGHGASRSLSKWSLDGAGLVRLPLGRDDLRSTAAARLSSRRRLSFFFLLFFLKREDVLSPWSRT